MGRRRGRERERKEEERSTDGGAGEEGIEGEADDSVRRRRIIQY